MRAKANSLSRANCLGSEEGEPGAHLCQGLAPAALLPAALPSGAGQAVGARAVLPAALGTRPGRVRLHGEAGGVLQGAPHARPVEDGPHIQDVAQLACEGSPLCPRSLPRPSLTSTLNTQNKIWSFKHDGPFSKFSVSGGSNTRFPFTLLMAVIQLQSAAFCRAQPLSLVNSSQECASLSYDSI